MPYEAHRMHQHYVVGQLALKLPRKLSLCVARQPSTENGGDENRHLSDEIREETQRGIFRSADE